MKFKLFLLAMATLMVVSIGVLNIVTYQSGKQEGLKEGISVPSEVVLDSSLRFPIADENYIEVEIVSENYEIDKLFLLKVSVGKEQVGIVYFDENEHIQFEGDKEKFERALLKILRARAEFFTAVEEGLKK